MSQPVTLEDIYQLFEKTNQQLEKSNQEINERFEQSRQEYDRRAAEADRRSAEADRRAAEADRRIAKLEKTVANTNRAVDGLTTRWGRFVEELVEPAVIKLFLSRGIDVKETFSRARVLGIRQQHPLPQPNLTREIKLLF